MNDDELHGAEAVSELERALFRAGRDDWPSEQALAKTLAAIGAGAAVTGIAGSAAGAGASGAAKAGAGLVSLASAAKWLGVGAVSGFLVSGVAYRFSEPAAPAFPAEQAPASEQALEPAPEPGPAPAPVPAPGDLEVASEPEAAPLRGASRAPAAPEAEGVPLAAEVALVDRGRAALRRGEPANALAELAGYERAFPGLRLHPEVLYLRMEALLRNGKTDQARAAAREIVRRYPSGPHGARAAAVLASDGISGPR